MLSYAFTTLNQGGYEDVATEEFENIHNLFAAILAKGISRQLKEGLYREYLNRKEDVAVVRGKIDMPGTIQNRLSRRRVLTCEYDELSENNLLNQILKTTVTLTTAIPAASYSIWKRCCIIVLRIHFLIPRISFFIITKNNLFQLLPPIFG